MLQECKLQGWKITALCKASTQRDKAGNKLWVMLNF